jgi:hypothetical protein
MTTLTKNDVILLGIFNTFGRFRDSDLSEDQKPAFSAFKISYIIGQIVGTGIRAIASAIVVYLTTFNLIGTVISMLVLIGGDTLLTTSKKT